MQRLKQFSPSSNLFFSAFTHWPEMLFGVEFCPCYADTKHHEVRIVFGLALFYWSLFYIEYTYYYGPLDESKETESTEEETPNE